MDEHGFDESFGRSAAADRRFRADREMDSREAVSVGEISAAVRGVAHGDETCVTRLAVAGRDGDREAIRGLIECVLPRVARVARRYAGRDLEPADLVQEGILGVLRAVERFDPDRGGTFWAYAQWWVRQAMQQAVAEQSRAVRLPRHVLWDIHRLRTARGDVLAETGREGSAQVLQERLGWSDARFDDTVRAERPAVSMDAPASSDAGEVDSLGDLVADPLSAEGYEAVLNAATAGAVRQLMGTLTGREVQVLRWRYGLDGEPELSLRQIGRRLGMSAERVRQIEQRAVSKLRSGAVVGS